jgi:hypothetical protein
MIREHLIKAHPARDGDFRWRGANFVIWPLRTQQGRRLRRRTRELRARQAPVPDAASAVPVLTPSR